MSASSVPGAPGPLAVVERGGVVESVHVGHLAVLAPDGEVRVAVGDVDAAIWPRSAVKPLQATALLRAGARLDEEGLALACASHSGTDAHLAVVRRVLASAGLAEDALQNTPDLPLDAAAARAWLAAGSGPSSVTQNCSGKHAAMLATCVARGWDAATYRSPDHPLQQEVRRTLEDLTGVEVAHATVDGCGAPLFSTSVRGLARAFGRLAAEPDGVARAMTAHPFLVGGPGRDVSRFMAAVPGLMAKDGAEGVYAAGLPDGSAVAFKVADGSARPRPVVMAAALGALLAAAGADAGVLAAVAEVGHAPVLGHGEPVGRVWPALGEPAERAVVGAPWTGGRR